MMTPMKPKHQTVVIDDDLRGKCLTMVLETAKKYRVPPAAITAHCVEPPQVNEARREVQRRMLSELGMRRHQIAKAFNRSLRRMRKSVLGV